MSTFCNPFKTNSNVLLYKTIFRYFFNFIFFTVGGLLGRRVCACMCVSWVSVLGVGEVGC